MALTVTISSQQATIQSGTKTIAGTISGSGQIDAIAMVTLVNGDNSIAVPAGVTGCLITPPAGNALVLKLKGVGGDTGIQIHRTAPTLIAFDAAALPASIIINSGGAMSAGTFLTVSWF